jgi:hypothetical protein
MLGIGSLIRIIAGADCGAPGDGLPVADDLGAIVGVELLPNPRKDGFDQPDSVDGAARSRSRRLRLVKD